MQRDKRSARNAAGCAASSIVTSPCLEGVTYRCHPHAMDDYERIRETVLAELKRRRLLADAEEDAAADSETPDDEEVSDVEQL